MREYDTTFVVQPEISEEAREALIEKLGGVVSRSGGMALEVEDIGKRKLAYEIQNFQKGHYLSLFFLGDGKAVSELERALKLEESVLRYLTIQKIEKVTDAEARKARGDEAERIRKERAAERAVREAEERAAREVSRLEAEEEARQRVEAADAAAAAATEAAAAAGSEESAEAETEETTEEGGESAPEKEE